MRRSQRSGFTLLEVALATALLASVLGAALMVVHKGSRNDQERCIKYISTGRNGKTSKCVQ